MCLPLSPAPLPWLQERYGRAVDHYHVEPFEPPGLDPVHVFDHEDGLRLIVCRVRERDRDWLMVSASYPPGSEFGRMLRRATVGFNPDGVFAYLAVQRFQELAGRRAIPLYLDPRSYGGEVNLHSDPERYE